MDIGEAVLRVQAAYPRIYLACHSRHRNARTTAEKVSQRDATLLAHLSESESTPQADLARHVGVAKSTLSEALSELEARGFVVRLRDETDGRGTMVRRTAAGSACMSGGSVLEPDRLRELVGSLAPEDRERAVAGLEILARAAGGK